MSKKGDILNHLLNLCHESAVILSIGSSRTLHNWSCDLKLNHFQSFFQSGFYPPELYSITAILIQMKKNKMTIPWCFCLHWGDFKSPWASLTLKDRAHRQTFLQPKRILRVRGKGKGNPSIDSGIQAFSSPRSLSHHPEEATCIMQTRVHITRERIWVSVRYQCAKCSKSH